tara:strand:+ start:61 stop:255 length:195 start_codon:yes stop_codon:yes gene_type:complete
MDFILKGKIKLLTQTFGVIDAIDYDETHFFQMIDVSKTDRNMLNKLLPNDFNFVYNICLFNYRR